MIFIFSMALLLEVLMGSVTQAILWWSAQNNGDWMIWFCVVWLSLQFRVEVELRANTFSSLWNLYLTKLNFYHLLQITTKVKKRVVLKGFKYMLKNLETICIYIGTPHWSLYLGQPNFPFCWNTNLVFIIVGLRKAITGSKVNNSFIIESHGFFTVIRIFSLNNGIFLIKQQLNKQ